MRHLLSLAAGASMALGAWAHEADAQVRIISLNPDGTLRAADKDTEVDLGSNGLNTWRGLRADDCLHVAEEPTSDTERVYDGLRTEIRAIPLGDQLFADLQNSNISMCDGEVQRAGNESLYYLDTLDITVIPTSFPRMAEDLQRGFLMMGTLHEMRHGWQDHLGLAVDPSALSQQAYMAQLFAMEADASAYSVAASWQLMTQQNDPDAWHYLERDRYYAPIAAAFEQGLAEAGYDATGGEPASADQMREALQAAYQAWFNDTPLPQIYRERAGDDLLNLPVMQGTADDQREGLMARFDAVNAQADASGAGRPDSYFGEQQAALAVSEALRWAPVVAAAPMVTAPGHER
ncbi:MAG: DUF6782 family putative metallopeptidase [Pseudomonadota bacterium]